MKRTFLSLVGLLVAMLTMAGPVSLQQAQQRAQQFLGQRGAAPTSGSMRLAKKQTKLEQATSASADAYYYVFNVGEQQGFVIVSGDDRTEEILGYADSGSFSEENMPDNMRAWLEGYQDQMRWMDEHNYQPSKAPQKTMAAIRKLLITTWNQGDPYNYYCPQVGGGIESVTGCVATAMAQVLAYHGLVKGKTLQTTAPIPGYRCETEWNGVPTDVAEKAVRTFDVANMIPAYTYDSENNNEPNFNEAQREAVARLMEYCGASVEMNYGPASGGGSGASSGDVAPAFINYFGFKANFVSRANYSYTQWQETIHSELVASRPVYYSGQSSGGGHAFVIDGYDGSGLFHVNWGWGSHCDGFFALSVLNSDDNTGIGASSSNDGYSFSQAAVIGVEPGTQGETPLSMSLRGSLSLSENTISFAAFNWTGAENTFDVAIAITDASGNIKKVKTIVDNYAFGINYGSNSFSSSIEGSDMPAGTYHVVPVSKLSSATDWVVMTLPKNYVEAVFDGAGNVTLTLFPQEYNLTATSIVVSGSKYEGQSQDVDVTIKNNGNGEFYGTLYLFASQNDTKGDYQNLGGATILGGKSVDMQFNFTPGASGKWNLWVATDYKGDYPIGNATVEIDSDPFTPTGDFMVTALTIQDADGDWQVLSDGTRTVDVLNATGDIILSPTFKNVSLTNYTLNAGDIHFKLEYLSGSQWISCGGYSNSGSVTIKAGEESAWGDMPWSSMPYRKYRFALTIGSNTDTHFEFYYAKEKVPTWAADGTPGRMLIIDDTTPIEIAADATVADLTELDLNTFTVTPSTNPNCLYLLANGASVPTALNGKNVVVGSEAEQINIVDNGTNGFYSPIAFTVTDKISYKRTFSKGYSSDGKGWSTISLPFSVTKVTTTNPDDSERVLDWCHSTDDTGKNFYLMAFTSDDGSGVAFSHANTFEANTPYIIAVAGPEFGDKWNLVNKELEFSATNAAVPATTEIVSSCSNYQFFGTLATTAAASIYKLNDDGNLFQLTNATELPFRAYFTAKGGNGDVSSLGIGFGNGTSTGIGPAIISTPNAGRQGVYTLSGVKVADGSSLDNLPAGIYVINGKKVIK